MPHVLATGPIGTGKRSVLDCIRKAMSPPPQKCVQVSAFDDISDVTFHKHMSILNAQIFNMNPRGYALVLVENLNWFPKPFHLVIARLLQNLNFKHLKFMFTCTDLASVAPMLRSRCAEIILYRLDRVASITLIDHIAQQFLMRLEDGAKNMLCFVSAGDARALTLALQTLYYAECSHRGSTIINEEHVLDLFDVPPPKTVVTLLGLCYRGDILHALQILVQKLVRRGYAFCDIYDTLRLCIQHPSRLHNMNVDSDVLVTLETLDERCRYDMLQTLYMVHRKALQGTSDLVQASGLVCRLTSLLSGQDNK